MADAGYASYVQLRLELASGDQDLAATNSWPSSTSPTDWLRNEWLALHLQGLRPRAQENREQTPLDRLTLCPPKRGSRRHGVVASSGARDLCH